MEVLLGRCRSSRQLQGLALLMVARDTVTMDGCMNYRRLFSQRCLPWLVARRSLGGGSRAQTSNQVRGYACARLRRCGAPLIVLLQDAQIDERLCFKDAFNCAESISEEGEQRIVVFTHNFNK